MHLKVAAGVVALAVLLALPAAQGSFAIDAATCTTNSFKWASSCFKTIEAGNTTFKAKEGLTLQGDQYFSTDAPIINGGELEPLYQQECAAKDIKVDITVPTGYYRVTIYEAEIYFVNATNDDNIYKCPRIFSICGESYLWEDDLCLYREGGINTAYPITKSIYVDDGSINLHFWSSLNMPKLAGVLVEGLDCAADSEDKLRIGPSAASKVCTDALKGIFEVKASPPLATTNATTNTTKPAAPAPATNGTTNGTTPGKATTPATKGNGTVTGETPATNGTDTTPAGETPAGATPAGETPAGETPVGTAPAPAPAGEPGSFGLPAGAPVPVATSRDLPELGGKPLATSITQYAASADADGISGPPDGTVWPADATAGENVTASASFGLPSSAKGLTLDGNFTKGDKVGVTVTGTDADGNPVSRDINVTAPTTGTQLPVPVPASLSQATVAGARITLPAGSRAKVDAVQLKGDLPGDALAGLQSYDPTTATLTQWPASGSDSVATPGLNGAGTNSVDVPDGSLWAPTGNGTRSITLNYTDAATPSHVLLAGAPKKGAEVTVLAHSDAAPAGAPVFEGAIPGANGTYGIYTLPLNASAVPANTTALTLSSASPAALGLDSAALVGTPADASKFDGSAGADQAGTPAGGAAGAASRELVLPVATSPGTWAEKATTGNAIIPSSGSVPAGTLDGSAADAAQGKPDGAMFAFPAAAKASKGSTPFLALEYPDGKKGNLVSVAGKAVAPGTLTAAVVDASGAITNLGAKELPTPSNDATYVNFTTPNGEPIDIKKVVLTPNPTSSWLTDAVEINTGSLEAAKSGSRGVELKKRKHRHQRINGSHGAWIAVITIFSVLGFCLCCLLPCILWHLAAKKKQHHDGASTGTYAAPAAAGGGLFGFLKKKSDKTPAATYGGGVTTPTVVKNPTVATNV